MCTEFEQIDVQLSEKLSWIFAARAVFVLTSPLPTGPSACQLSPRAGPEVAPLFQ